MDTPAPSDRDLDFDAQSNPGADNNFQQIGEIREAVLRFLQGGVIDNAASLIASSSAELGDTLIDLDAKAMSPALRESLADAFFRARDYERAARVAALLENPERAAHFFEKSGQFAKAAVIFERLGQIIKAAELHERANNHPRAAALFEQVGKLDRAAEALERSGKLYEAGRLWARQRKLDRALEVLQRVDSSSPTFVPAMQLLGRILEYTGHRDAAAARYLEVVHARPLDATTLEIHERLIDLYVQAGNAAEARRLINKVLRFDPARQRAARALGMLLGKGSTEATMRSEVSTSTPPPGPNSLPKSSGPAITVTAVTPTVDALRQLPLFAELSLSELRSLHSAGDRCVYAPGEIMIEQDAEGTSFFVVLGGAVHITRTTPDGAEVFLAELRYGACIGEMALLDEGPTSARVRAASEVQAFRWPMDRLRALLAADERVALRILRVASRALSVRLRETSSRVR